MTVAELIEVLKTMPQDSVVTMYDGDGDRAVVQDVIHQPIIDYCTYNDEAPFVVWKTGPAVLLEY